MIDKIISLCDDICALMFRSFQKERSTVIVIHTKDRCCEVELQLTVERVLEYNDINLILGKLRLHRFEVTSIVLDNNVYALGDKTFKNFIGMKTITLPSSLYVIGNDAFYNCISLGGKLELPDTLIYLGTTAFYGCRFNEIVLPLTASCSDSFQKHLDKYQEDTEQEDNNDIIFMGKSYDMHQERQQQYLMQISPFYRNLHLTTVKFKLSTYNNHLSVNLDNLPFEECHSLSHFFCANVTDSVWHDLSSISTILDHFGTLSIDSLNSIIRCCQNHIRVNPKHTHMSTTSSTEFSPRTHLRESLENKQDSEEPSPTHNVYTSANMNLLT